MLANVRLIRPIGAMLASIVFGLAAVLWQTSPASATTLPVVNKSGVLSSDETWVSGNVYFVDNVTVPNGKTLTINAGAIVKSNVSDGIIVASGGQLNINGMSMADVTFTSYTDDSAGGDSNNDGASIGTQGGYTFVIGESGSRVNVQHASFEYQMRSVTMACSNTSADEFDLSNSTLKSQLYVMNCKPDYASITGNTFQVGSNYYPVIASQIDPSIFPLAGLGANTVTGSGKAAAMYLSGGRIDSSSQWTISSDNGLDALYLAGTLDVYGGLAIEPGSVIKVDNDTSADVMHANNGGIITANGTSLNPITITSISDDSIGGDSNGNGVTTVSVNSFNTVFAMDSGGLNASFLEIRGARVAISAYCTSSSGDILLTDTLTEGSVNLNGCNSDDASIMRNSFDVTGQYPISLVSSSISVVGLDGTDMNTFSGSDKTAALYLYNSYLQTGAEWKISTATGLDAIVSGGLNVGNGSTVNFGPGVVVKAIQSSYAIVISSDASLIAEGTISDPVTFTSIEDDSIAGDSAGDGVTTGAPHQYYAAIKDEGGDVEMVHTVLQYGDAAIEDSGNLASSSKGLLSVVDSMLKSPLSISKREDDKLYIARNFFETDNVYPIQASNIDANAIVMTGSNKNEFVGTDREAAMNLYQPTIASGETWDVDASTGMDSLRIDQMNVNGTFNVQPGIVLKISGYIQVNNGGHLDASGTSLAPVVFTTLDDDSVGGDTNGDGSTTGSVDPYTTSLKVMNGGEAALENAVFTYSGVAFFNEGDLNVADSYIGHVGTGFQATGGSTTRSTAAFDNTDIEYATNGLYVGNYSTVMYHGSVTNTSNKALQSCNWLEACWVDASYTDWGSTSGPFPSTGSLVCGQVLVTPWTSSTGTYTGQPLDINNCGLTTSPSQELETKAHTFNLALGDKVADCDQSIQDACDAAEAMKSCVQTTVVDLSSIVYPTIGFAVPTAHSPSEAAEQYSGDLLGAASAFFNGLAYNSTEARGLRLANTALAVVGLGNSYDDCLNQ